MGRKRNGNKERFQKELVVKCAKFLLLEKVLTRHIGQIKKSQTPENEESQANILNSTIPLATVNVNNENIITGK